jgi:hypothetical protein
MAQSTNTPRKPYVSAKRNEPRIIDSPPPIFEKDYDEKKYLAKYADPKAGRLTYRTTGPGFLETYNESKVRKSGAHFRSVF